MPTINVPAETYAQIRTAAIARGCTNEAVIVDLIIQSAPAWDPALVEVYEFNSLLVMRYDGRFAGLVVTTATAAHPPQSGRAQVPRQALEDLCAWFQPIALRRRLRR